MERYLIVLMSFNSCSGEFRDTLSIQPSRFFLLGVMMLY